MRSVFALIMTWLNKLLQFGARFIGVATDQGGDSGEKADGDDVENPPVERPDPDSFVCYYGCPNSKKAQKLQLSKRVYR